MKDIYPLVPRTARVFPARKLPVLVAAAMMVLAGCSVGPNFKHPAAPAVNGYTREPLMDTASTKNISGGDAQRFVTGGDIAGDWWSLFHSRPLNDLISLALTNNPDLQAAQAALTVAQENVLAQRGAYFPAATAGFSATRQKQSHALAPTPNSNAFQYNLFTPQVSVSYSPDVFGLNRRTMESLKAQQAGVRYQMIATYTTLTANVVVTAIQEGAMETQIDATRQLIELNSNMVVILKYQQSKGYAGRLDVVAQESQLAQVIATLPPLLKQSAQLRDQLAVLAGRFPGQTSDQSSGATFELSSLQLPADLPVSLPAQLVAQRPDVLQAEANYHAASAQVGIAIANRLPNITLTASAGSSALSLDKLFTSGTGFWGLGAAAAAPLFEGGQLLHTERAAKAAYVEAAEQYRSTVLSAFQNVADTLTALQQDADGLNAAATAANDARETLDLSRRQWHDGYLSYLALLSAEQAYQQTRINLVQAQASRFADTAALFQALGGGWWHRDDLTKDKK